MVERPKTSNSSAEKELDKAEKNFQEFDQNIKAMTLDRMNEAPTRESEQQTRMSSKEAANTKELYIKPKRTISCKEKFDEKFRADYEYAKEYVCFIAENKEIIGESINMWTKSFPGVCAEEWEIPVNKPVWAPRYVAENIKKASYHRFVMKDNATETSGMGTIYGTMAVDSVVQRLDATPYNKKKSIFLGNEGF